MRTYIRIFLNTLMPISLAITIGAVIYFSFNYDFSKSLKLGFLTGVLIGFPLSFIASFILLLQKRRRPIQQETDQVIQHTNMNVEASSTDRKTPSEQKLMLLMDKNLAFDVALFSITDQNLGDATIKETKEKSTITLRTYTETIQIITTSLTRHTAQVLIKGVKDSQELVKIISYIKEKEYSFLQY